MSWEEATDDGGPGGGMVIVPDMTGEGSLTPCGTVTWPGMRRPPDGGLYDKIMIIHCRQYGLKNNIQLISR